MFVQGEKTRKAVAWISENLKGNAAANIKALVNEAISKYDLNPKEAEELMVFYQRAQEKKS